MKKQQKEKNTEIKKIAEFKLIYQHNVDNLALALLRCGYFVNVSESTEQVTSFKTIRVFTDRI